MGHKQNKMLLVFVWFYLNWLNAHVLSQCTFGSTFANTDWHDNTKGALSFSTTEMDGWEFNTIRVDGTQTITQWQCHNHSDDNFLVLRTKTTFRFQSVSSITQVYGYLCLQLTSITQHSFIYYQRHVQEIRLGGERIKVSVEGTLTQSEICDSSVSVPTTEYHVLVKSGSESSAAIQCPDNLLFRADYTYIAPDGSLSCTGSSDTWDVCSNKKQMKFNYNSCSQPIAFSAEGQFYCVANIRRGGYDFTTIFNMDSALTSSTSQFACISYGDGSASVAPGNCTGFQTPTSFPLQADQSTPMGHRLIVTNEYEDCGPPSSNSLSPGAIAGIVISVLFVVGMWTTCAVIAIIVLYIAFRVFLILILELSGVTDVIPLTVLTITDDIDDAKGKAKHELESVKSPSSIILNGKVGDDSPRVHNGFGVKSKEEKNP